MPGESPNNKPESLSRRTVLKETLAFGAGLGIGAGVLEKHLDEKLSELSGLHDHSLTESDKALDLESDASVWRNEQIRIWREAVKNDPNLSDKSETIKELNKFAFDTLKEFNYLEKKIPTLQPQSSIGTATLEGNGMANIRLHSDLERQRVLHGYLVEIRENLLFVKNLMQKRQEQLGQQSAALSEK